MTSNVYPFIHLYSPVHSIPHLRRPHFLQVLRKYPSVLVVVDEAYIDFSGTASACELINGYANLVVLQTMSKAFGLAGIRLGMAYSRRGVIDLMNNIKAPYNVNKLTARAALDALSNHLPRLQANITTLLQERAFLYEQLAKMPVVKKLHDSDANFFLMVVPRAQEVYKRMADRGVVTRFRGNEMHCKDCIRLSVGTRKDNEAFLKLFTAITAEMGLC